MDPEAKDSDELLSDEQTLESGLEDHRHRNYRRTITLLAVAQAITVTLLIAAIVLLSRKGAALSDAECTRRLSVYSPLLDVVEYEEKDFVNPFAHKTIYRGPPTAERDAAWRELWYYESISIPEEHLWELNRSSGIAPDGTSLSPVEDGQDGYQALIEVFHQLHCLDLVRKYTWKDYYAAHRDEIDIPHEMLDSDVAFRMHTDHCIEALRLSLMCHGDVTPYFVRNDPSANGGRSADFSPHHKCRKFEPLVAFMKENALQ